MKKLVFTAVLAWASAALQAAELYSHFEQPPQSTGGLVKSSWWSPDSSDYDEHVWDSFTLPTTQSVVEIRWRGGRAPTGFGGPVVDFQVRLYGSVGSQPDVTAGPIADYSTGGNAGETPAGTFGGVAMKDYRFALPVPFVAEAGIQYWVQILAAQNATPDWGLAVGTRGNGTHIHLTPGTHLYLNATDDMAFSLWTEDPNFTISTGISPAGSGTVTGDGTYTSGATVTLAATPNPGYAFVSWKQGVTVVSTSSTYTFTAGSDQTLTANFAPAFTISTSASPVEAGTTSGDGSYLTGSTITVRAVANPGFKFLNWTQNGSVVSSSSNYQFTVTASRDLVANFTPVYTITTSALPAEGGTTTGGGTFTNGASVTVTATANPGFAFVNWTENDSVVSSSINYQFTVTASRTLIANFTPVYTIATSALPAEGGTTTGGGTFTNGASVTVTATANPGFAFVNWTENGSEASTSPDYTFLATSSGTLVANFKATCTVTATAVPAIGGTITGCGTVTNGALVELQAMANTGFVFVNWTENGTEIGNSPAMSFVATANRTVVANFAPRLTAFLTSTNTIVLSWPAPLPEYSLQQTPALADMTAWEDSTNVVSVIGSESEAVIPATPGASFFRLYRR